MLARRFHIKGLVLNWLHHFWPSLVRASDFLVELRTPLIKVFGVKEAAAAAAAAATHNGGGGGGGRSTLSFFSLKEYEQWQLQNIDGGTPLTYIVRRRPQVQRLCN